MILIYACTLVAGVLSPICIKAVMNTGSQYNEIVFWRSLIVLMIVLPALFWNKDSRLVFKSGLSFARVLVGGTVLTLTTYAFKFLPATDVSALSRLDLPFFLLIFGNKESKALPISVIAAVAVYSVLPMHHGSFLGVAALWLAALLTAISYWLIRKVALQKSLFMLVAPPYFGAILVSLVLVGSVPRFPEPAALILIAGSSICSIALYVLTSLIFLKSKLGAAELTGCASLFLTFLVERLFLDRQIPVIVGVSSLAMGLICWLIVYQDEVKLWIQRKV